MSAVTRALCFLAQRAYRCPRSLAVNSRAMAERHMHVDSRPSGPSWRWLSGLAVASVLGVPVAAWVARSDPAEAERKSRSKKERRQAEVTAPKSHAEMFYSHLLPQRKVFVNGRVDDTMAHCLVGQLLYLEQKDPSAPIYMFINSEGGRVTSGLAIYDVMQSISPPVYTVCIGHAESMGAILLSAGEPGFRWAMPNAHIMVHQPTHSMSGKTTDISIKAARAEGCARNLTEILSKHTGQMVI
mmetsp:Transcript_15862/g.30578  ORF Transcript_15862/g.30578 Transcript_15862/m.30578 type:complete len:242 (+) Transcript_15862:272-997(+)